jgi:hypothetical protein
MSRVMKVWYSPFPFNIDHIGSSMAGIPVCTVNTNHDPETLGNMKVTFE